MAPGRQPDAAGWVHHLGHDAHGHTTTFHDATVIQDGAVRKEPTYLTDFWTRRGVEFIEENREQPFFLFLAYNGPYGLGARMMQPARTGTPRPTPDQE